MKRIVTLFALTITLLFSYNNTVAAVTVTPATGGCSLTNGGAYTTLGNIVITENNNGDFSILSGVTIILVAPTNFVFNAGAGAVTFAAGQNITNAAIAVTAGSITVTYTVTGTNRTDVLTISGIQARASSANVIGQILRLAGTGTIAGDANGGGVNHGTLVQGTPTITSNAAGNWSASATWVGGIAPTLCGPLNVVINHSVTADVTQTVNDLTINTGGNLTSTNAITVNGTFAINGTGAYTHNNTTAASTTIFNGTENFGTTSSIIVNNWSSAAVPLATGVSGNFGNITSNYASVWDQDGMFSPNKIKGNLTVTGAQMNMDDGTGATTVLTIDGSVTTSGSGTIIFAQGANRNLTLTTGAVTHNGAGLMCGMYQTHGVLTWVVNGDAVINQDFTAIQGSGAPVASTTNFTVTGNFSVGSASLFDFNRQLGAGNNSPATIKINGNTTISSSGWFRCIDAGTGTLNFTTTDLTISAGTANDFVRGTGIANINVTGNAAFSGSSFTNFIQSTTSTASCNVAVTGSLTMTGASTELDMQNGDGSLTLNAGSIVVTNGTLYGVDGGNGVVNVTTTGSFNQAAGICYLVNIGNGNVTMNVGTSFNLTGGTFREVVTGDGDVFLTTGGVFNIDAGDFRGIYNLSTYTAGNFTFNFNSIDYDGGIVMGQYGCNTENQIAVVNVTNNADFNFTAAESVWWVGLGTLGVTNCSLGLNMTVGGNLIFSGLTSGTFRSNNGTGNETIAITGSVICSGGTNSFNMAKASGLTNYHNVVGTVGGDINISGGLLYLSSKDNNAVSPTCTWGVAGNVAVTGGTLAVKSNDGTAVVSVTGNYSQTNGVFVLHEENANSTANVVGVAINGTFSHTGGTLNFDDNTSSTAIHTITVNGTSCTVGGTGSMTHASAGTGSVFGEFYFVRAGTTTYNRSATTHTVQQVKYYVNSGCTVDASSTANDFQIASNATQGNISTNGLNVNGILNMGAAKITAFGGSLTNYYSGMRVNSGGRLRTSNASGFYDGTTSACLQPQVFSGNANFRMDYNLDANSTVEYYASGNQVVTGKFPNAGALGDVALATAAQYHYGYLDINNQGTLGTNYANPASAGTGNVFVRTSLVLTRGELNLAGSGTGQTITLENGATTGITRDGATTTGYVKSEEVNAGNNRAKIAWNMGANTGAHIYPFGYTTGAGNYIPFTFNKTTAGVANIAVSTRATASNDNTPWAAASSVGAVNDMSSNMGGYADASIPSVIDRWWDITASAAVTGDLTFSYRGAENTTTLTPTGNFGAQHWNGTGWDVAVGSNVGVTTGVGTVSASGQSTFSPWVLSYLNAALPIELLYFNNTCDDKSVLLTWGTASETNNNYFTIEKSTDGVNFKELTRVYSKSGNGNSNTQLEYNYLDNDSKGAYYRLKQTDIDGKNEILKMIFNEGCSLLNSSIAVYAFDKNVTLDVNSASDKTFTLELFNSMGQIVLTKELAAHAGSNDLKIDCSHLSDGVYFVNVLEETTQRLAKKIMLSK